MYVPLCFIRFATVNLSVPGARSMALAVLPLPALFEYLSSCCLDRTDLCFSMVVLVFACCIVHLSA